MGNLNQFYLLGRVARAPETVEVEGRSVVRLVIHPGTSPRPRGRPTPSSIPVEADGAQLQNAQSLRRGMGVLLRGQLRTETRKDNDGAESTTLIAHVQSIEPLASRRALRPDDEDSSKSGRRRRGRRGRKDGEDADANDAVESVKDDLPPHEPVAPTSSEPVEPPNDPTYESDIPM